MGCVSRLPLAQLSEIQIAVRLVPLYLEFDPADKPLLQKEPMGLAECTLSSEEPVPTVRAPASAEFRLIWTLMILYIINISTRSVKNYYRMYYYSYSTIYITMVLTYRSYFKSIMLDSWGLGATMTALLRL